MSRRYGASRGEQLIHSAIGTRGGPSEGEHERRAKDHRGKHQDDDDHGNHPHDSRSTQLPKQTFAQTADTDPVVRSAKDAMTVTFCIGGRVSSYTGTQNSTEGNVPWTY